MEKYRMKLKKQMDDEKDWSESKGSPGYLEQQYNYVFHHGRILESEPKFAELQKQHDVVGLFDLIKDLVYSTDNTQEPTWVMADAMCKLYATAQAPNEDKSTYYKRLVSRIEVTESVWGVH